MKKIASKIIYQEHTQKKFTIEIKNTGKIAFLYIEKFVFYLPKKKCIWPETKYTYIPIRYWRIEGLHSEIGA